MNLKYILIVWGAMLFCVGCSEDDVDSSYSFDVAGLKATVTNDKGSVVEMNTILLDSLKLVSLKKPGPKTTVWLKKNLQRNWKISKISNPPVCYSFYPEKGSW